MQFYRFVPALVVAAATAACAPQTPIATPGPVEGNSFVVRDVRVFDGTRTLERVHVVVREGRIEHVGRGRLPRELPVIDGTGLTLLPGLINAHGHVSSEAGLRDALRFGVTTVLDMLTAPEFARSQRSRREQLVRTDLADMYSAGAPATSPGGMATQFGIPFTTISGPEEADAFVRGRIADGSDYIKIMHEPDAGIVSSISRETLAAVVRAARAHGVLAVVHVSSVRGARDAVAAGANGLAHLFSDTILDDELAREMARRGMFVTTTLSIYSGFNNTGFGRTLAADPRVAPYLTEKQRTGLTQPGPGPDYPMAPYLTRFQLQRALENVSRLRAGGVRILAGDDAPNLGAHGASLHGELELLTRGGLTPAEALAAATREPAEAFRLNDRGRIEIGARADLLLVDGNLLQDITTTRAIVRVFKNGFEVPRAQQ